MKIPFITLSISAIICALFATYGSAPVFLTWFTSEGVTQPLKLLSAHFVHSDLEHLIWNVSAFILLGSIVEQHSKRCLLLALSFGIVCVNIFLLTLFKLNAYVGLSGVLNTILIVALFHLCQKPVYRAAAIWTMVLSMLKIMFELHSSTSLFTSISWAAVPQAHLAGWLGGVAFVTFKTAKYFGINKHKLYKEIITV